MATAKAVEKQAIRWHEKAQVTRISVALMQCSHSPIVGDEWHKPDAAGDGQIMQA
jgi:hypothetical protein